MNVHPDNMLAITTQYARISLEDTIAPASKALKIKAITVDQA